MTRDCEHGRQTGKCADCDVTALELELVQVRGAVDRLTTEIQRYRGLDKILTHAREVAERQAADPDLWDLTTLNAWQAVRARTALTALHDALKASA